MYCHILSYCVLPARLVIFPVPAAGLFSLAAGLVPGPSFFHYDLPRPGLTQSTNVKDVLQDLYVSNTVVQAFLITILQLGCVTLK